MLDADIVSLFFRGDPQVRQRFDAYLEADGIPHLSLVTVYEILSGLKHRDARKQLGRFQALAAESVICPLTASSVEISARLYAELRHSGQTLDDIDLLIAGTALANDCVLVTHNRKHFDRIQELAIEDWAGFG